MAPINSASTISATSGALAYSTQLKDTNPVSPTSNAALPSVVVTLSAEANIIAGLSNGTGNNVVYDAVSLLNSISQAGAPPLNAISVPNAGTNTQVTVQQSDDQAIAQSLSSSPEASGIYTNGSAIQGLPSDVSSNFATALKANPGLASTVINDSVTQGIVGNLLATA